MDIHVQVKKNRHRHTCTSARRSKDVKHATNIWVFDVVKDWLIEDSKQLRKTPTRRRQWRTSTATHSRISLLELISSMAGSGLPAPGLLLEENHHDAMKTMRSWSWSHRRRRMMPWTRCEMLLIFLTRTTL